MDWKPIETAPKDGTNIIARVDGFYKPGVVFTPIIVGWRDDAWHIMNPNIDGHEIVPVINWEPDSWIELPTAEGTYSKVHE